MLSEARVFRYYFGPCIFTPANRELRYGSVLVVVPAQEAQILEQLLLHPGKVVSKADFAAILWPEAHYGEFDRAIHNLISKLRKIHPKSADWIVTIPKAGYKFSLAVRCEEEVVPLRRMMTSRGTITEALEEVQKSEDSLVPREDTLPLDRLANRTALPGAASEKSSPLLERRWSLILLSIAFLAIVAASAIRKYHRSSPPPATSIKLGVLPFTGPDGETTEGETLREELDDSLAALPNIEVRAAHSLTRAMSTSNAQSAAQQLNIDVMIAGNYQNKEGRYSLTLEVIRSRDGMHLTSLHYDGPASSLGALPDRIAADLSPLLEKRPGDSSAQRMLGSTTSQDAYERAFHANELLLQRRRSDVEQAISLYRQALSFDPGYAKAWAGLAEGQLVLANFGSGPDTENAFEGGRKAARQALTLDPNIAQAHSSLGLILLQYDWNLRDAEQQLQMAVRSNPGVAANHMRMAILMSDEGRNAEAEAEIAQAREVDPHWPVIEGTAMYVDIMARKYDKAIDDAQALVAARPDWSRAHDHLGWAFWYAGRHAPAIRQWRQAALLDMDTQGVTLQERGIQILEQQGVAAYAQFRLMQHPQRAAKEEDFVPAEWYAFKGDRMATLDALEAMIRSRNPESLKIRSNPAYDFLRNDPRFQRLTDLSQQARR